MGRRRFGETHDFGLRRDGRRARRLGKRLVLLERAGRRNFLRKLLLADRRLAVILR
jgi:hypothetical protein